MLTETERKAVEIVLMAYEHHREHGCDDMEIGWNGHQVAVIRTDRPIVMFGPCDFFPSMVRDKLEAMAEKDKQIIEAIEYKNGYFHIRNFHRPYHLNCLRAGEDAGCMIAPIIDPEACAVGWIGVE